MIELLLTAFYIGALHVFSSPDHIAVLVPLGILKKEKSWQVGLLWSLGHFIGLFVLGSVLYYFKSLIDLTYLEKYNFLYVGLLLLFVGIWTVYKSKHINITHLKRRNSENIKKISFSTGLIHGVIGFSHIYSLAPTLSMQKTPFIAYFISFAVGTTLSVMLLTYLLFFIPNKIKGKDSLYSKLCRWSGFIAVGMGCILLVFFFCGINITTLLHHH